MWNLLLDFLFPRRSLTGQAGELITREEFMLLRSRPVEVSAEELRSLNITSLDHLFACGLYQEHPLLARAIRSLKYQRIPELGALLAKLLSDAPFTKRGAGAVLCPVPLHWSRTFQRGFNQAEIIAEQVASNLKLPMVNLLKRIRSTGHQARRTRDERLVAVRDAFAVRMNPVPSHIILIDDVATTCATLDHCARALKSAGAKRVEAWVLARD